MNHDTVIATAAMQRAHIRNLKAALVAAERAKTFTASQLARKLAKNERTVYRYIDQLQAAGAPIVGTASKGYRWYEKEESCT